MASLQGAGYLLVNDILTDCAFALIQPSVSTLVPAGDIAVGVQTVAAWDVSMYVGAQLVVGVMDSNLEVVTIAATVPGTSFTATFANAHQSGELIRGATFPVRQTGDPLFTQAEMIGYLSTAMNDFLVECPLVYTVNKAVPIAPAAQIADLPIDCMVPIRVAINGYPLRETSQTNLDTYDYRWQQRSPVAPTAYFRDKVGIQNFGIWPRQNNKVTCEIVYQQRASEMMGLGDGFLLPDPFLPIVKFRTLSFAYSKDGESRNPALARYWQSRYEFGVKLSQMIVESIADPNLELTQ